ncbi:MAG: hypothetical protein IT483_10920 [Gammaproteobacteria bacterium]|nr:hypothetical protein [Gammaproteobacteria bacterium]
MAIEIANFLAAAIAMIALGLVIQGFRALWSGQDRESPRSATAGNTLWPKVIFAIFGAILVAAPLASYLLSSIVEPANPGKWTFLLIGLFAFLSLPLTLALARLAGRNTYDGYWLQLLSGARISRRAFVRFWIGVSTFVLAVGVATLF